VKLTRLYERTSKKTGNQYFTGRLGAAKVVMLKSREVTEEGGAIWDVLLQEGQADTKRPKADAQEPLAEATPTPAPYTQQRLKDDAIPF
jgi:hypothetical protein